MKSDRVAGCVLLFGASWYLLEARSFQTGFIADPIGPRAFPYVLGTLLVGLSILLAFRPGIDPCWPSRFFWWRSLVVVVALFSYAAVLTPLGFIVSTTCLLVVVSTIFGGRFSRSLAFALVSSVVSTIVFRLLLALNLPLGTIFWGGR